MTPRNSEVSQVFTRWLDRYSPPQSIKEKPQAVQDEADNLLRTLIRCAPQENARQWTERVLVLVSDRMKTRAWPTASEILDAAKSFGGSSGDRKSLSRDEEVILQTRIIPTARRWLGIPGLREHGERTLQHWGEEI